MPFATPATSSRRALRLARDLALVALIASFGLADAADGSPASPPQRPAPIDQAVADADPLAVSLRRIETGLRADGEQTSLYRDASLTQPGSGSGSAAQSLVRVAPGLVARTSRIDYLVLRGERDLALNQAPEHDGQFIEILAANVVFDLTPARAWARHHHVETRLVPRRVALPSPNPPTSRPRPRASSSGPIDARIDGRIDGQVHRRIDGRVNRATPHRID